MVDSRTSSDIKLQSISQSLYPIGKRMTHDSWLDQLYGAWTGSKHCITKQPSIFHVLFMLIFCVSEKSACRRAICSRCCFPLKHGHAPNFQQGGRYMAFVILFIFFSIRSSWCTSWTHCLKLSPARVRLQPSVLTELATQVAGHLLPEVLRQVQTRMLCSIQCSKSTYGLILSFLTCSSSQSRSNSFNESEPQIRMAAGTNTAAAGGCASFLLYMPPSKRTVTPRLATLIIFIIRNSSLPIDFGRRAGINIPIQILIGIALTTLTQLVESTFQCWFTASIGAVFIKWNIGFHGTGVWWSWIDVITLGTLGQWACQTSGCLLFRCLEWVGKNIKRLSKLMETPLGMVWHILIGLGDNIIPQNFISMFSCWLAIETLVSDSNHMSHLSLVGIHVPVRPWIFILAQCRVDLWECSLVRIEWMVCSEERSRRRSPGLVRWMDSMGIEWRWPWLTVYVNAEFIPLFFPIILCEVRHHCWPKAKLTTLQSNSISWVRVLEQNAVSGMAAQHKVFLSRLQIDG